MVMKLLSLVDIAELLQSASGLDTEKIISYNYFEVNLMLKSLIGKFCQGDDHLFDDLPDSNPLRLLNRANLPTP